ncbi:signal peptidase 22kDa subunit [Fimicolochytrium jonesii]|uniref:signal peptidase 22kDa subunit n=1 Tax=Fimicolochytrium jonesii TaxID=1396493 RepID=UPI0022FF2CBC|nr:signal peptidase 22kDa subunit [Fimicolochytrium jonesii]KAI8816437.1 signal peptidase 22kDa subunit [Fimicolochytrium jonesii]
MYSALQRLNALSAFFVTVVFCVLGAVALSGPILNHSAVQKVEAPVIGVQSVVTKLGRQGYYYDYSQPKTEIGFVHFNVTADLSPIWNWNTKQLFVYLVAEYETPSHSTNQIMLWDDIILTKEDTIIELTDQLAEYRATDIQNKLAGVQAKLSLHWNVIPHVGILLTDAAGSAPLTFPKVTK